MFLVPCISLSIPLYPRNGPPWNKKNELDAAAPEHTKNELVAAQPEKNNIELVELVEQT